MTHASNRAKSITRKTKALTLIPVTIASVTATVAVLVTTGATATLPIVAKPVTDAIPTVIVPSQPIQAPATVNRIAPKVRKNASGAIIVSSYTNGIPTVALTAYQRAAEVINDSDPSCNMPWELIAAIGRVESDNGQFGGSQLTTAGEAVPPIYGPVLDGKDGMALIPNTGDSAALDGNAPYQRAVGPMQFLPSTWAVVGQDGNGDGKKDPQNIYDATLAAAVYLCSGDSNMATAPGRESAVLRYNHSDSYVKLVLAIMQAYEQGNYSSIPTGAYAAPATHSKNGLPKKKHKSGKTVSAAGSQPSKTPTTSASSSGSPSPTPSASPSSSNPLQGLLNGLSGKKSSTPTPSASSAKMTSSQAASYCASKLAFGALNTSYAACTRKLTGMTQAEADSGWAANKSNLAGWFKS